MRDSRMMNDAEVAELFGICKATLQRRVKHPKRGEIDYNLAEPRKTGGKNVWVRAKVEALAGLAGIGGAE